MAERDSEGSRLRFVISKRFSGCTSNIGNNKQVPFQFLAELHLGRSFDPLCKSLS